MEPVKFEGIKIPDRRKSDMILRSVWEQVAHLENFYSMGFTDPMHLVASDMFMAIKAMAELLPPEDNQ